MPHPTLVRFARLARLAGPALLAALVGSLALLGGRALAGADPQDAAPSKPREIRWADGAALDVYLRRLEAFGFAGAVLIARRGEVLVDKGYGFADEASREPFTPDTLFDVASVSKQFTAAAILELELEGRLRVEDTVARFFPAAPPDKSEITLHQLLSHTSGLPDVLGGEYEPVSRDEMLRRVFAARLVLPPGKRFRYSNAGYNLLAAVAEIASGRPLGELMRDKLFLPAGMRHTGFRLPAGDRPRLAHGYGLDGPWGTPLDHPWAADGPYWNLRGNGGVLSTTRDLYRWHLALAGGAILSPAEREKLFSPNLREGTHSPARYAYGWSIAPGPSGGPVASHTGGNGVFDTDVRRYLDDGAVLIAASNRADYSAVAVAAHLENRLFGLPDREPPAPARTDPEQLARCAGAYRLPSGERLRVAAPAGAGLRVSAEGPAGLALLLADQDDEERGAMKEREQQAGAAFESARQGDWTDLADLLGQTPEELEDPFRGPLRRYQRQLGTWTGTAVLGSASVDGVPSTYARLAFERGARLAQLRWSGPTVEAVRYPEQPAGRLYLAEAGAAPTAVGGELSSVRFGAYDVRTGAVQRVRVELPRRGPSRALVFETPAGDVRAPRTAG